ncbi:CNNM domain-containing protein [Halorussus sp. AFM4]|uniref:CNNM domain-containing protein n=1 Tax=Halorussus sp. AFM4 TaxID=3421651 RepID=UPI003EBCA4A3
MPELTTSLAAVAAVVSLLALSAFFSSSETAIFSLPAGWPAERAAAGDRRAVHLDALREDPHRLLVTLLVGNNLVNVALSSVVTVLLVDALPPGVAVTAATVVVTSVVLVFGEIVPKSYGLGNNEAWALRVARPVTLVGRLLRPLVSLFDAVTRSASRRLGGDADIEEPYLDD